MKSLADGDWGEKHDYAEGDYSPLFAVASTAYGDGEYPDHRGKDYAVDSGTIGVVNITDESVCRPDLKNIDEFGRVVVAKRYLRFTAEDGLFQIEVDGDIYEIDTNGNDDEEEDYKDEYSDDYEEEEEYEE